MLDTVQHAFKTVWLQFEAIWGQSKLRETCQIILQQHVTLATRACHPRTIHELSTGVLIAACNQGYRVQHSCGGMCTTHMWRHQMACCKQIAQAMEQRSVQRAHLHIPRCETLHVVSSAPLWTAKHCKQPSMRQAL